MFRANDEPRNLRDRHMAGTLDALVDHVSRPGTRPARWCAHTAEVVGAVSSPKPRSRISARQPVWRRASRRSCCSSGASWRNERRDHGQRHRDPLARRIRQLQRGQELVALGAQQLAGRPAMP
jgi:hypothetical protein